MTSSEKQPRKKNPSYEVFIVHNDVHTRILGGPWNAPSRSAAAELAATTAKVGIGEDQPEDAARPNFLVIPADEYKVIAPRVRVERSVSWEPLPDPPMALQPTANGQAAAAGKTAAPSSASVEGGPQT